METMLPGGIVAVMREEVLVGWEERKNMNAMVAIDDSEESYCALTWTLDKLFTFPGVAPERNRDAGMITLVHVQPYSDATRRAQEEKAATILTRAFQMCVERMVKAETLILDGDPKEMIVQATETMKVDLLVVGSRGLGKIKRALLGSVSDYCVHHAKCPVLVVKPRKETERTT